jgi:hypothetical protein
MCAAFGAAVSFALTVSFADRFLRVHDSSDRFLLRPAFLLRFQFFRAVAPMI